VKERMSKNVSLEILQSLSDATTEVVQKVAPSVVSVNCGMGRGSGVVWSSDGYIVTCSHVTGRRKTVTVGLGEGKSFEAKVVGHDPYSDVALLKIEGMTLKPADFGDSEILKTGQFVLALANPFNRQPSATSGIITNVAGSIRGFGGMVMENVVVTDAQLNPGYSGGPLVDVLGKVVGLNAACAWSRGIAIPVNTVRKIVDGLARDGDVRRAYLGIEAGTIPLPSDVAALTETQQHSAVLVLSVERNSAAKKAGLALGDIIVKFDEEPVANLYDLTRLLTAEKIGKQAKLGILRGEQALGLTVIPNASKAEGDD
jgi:S1-C subfamily serine protease